LSISKKKNLEGAEVNSLAKQDFYQRYGNIFGIIWKRTINYDQVSFTSDGEAMNAYYDANVKLVGTVIQKKLKTSRMIHRNISMKSVLVILKKM